MTSNNSASASAIGKPSRVLLLRSQRSSAYAPTLFDIFDHYHKRRQGPKVLHVLARAGRAVHTLLDREMIAVVKLPRLIQRDAVLHCHDDPSTLPQRP